MVVRSFLLMSNLHYTTMYQKRKLNNRHTASSETIVTSSQQHNGDYKK